MTGFRIGRYALAIGIVAGLAGCAGSQSPLGTPNALPQSWMLPDASARDLLYVGDHYEGIVYVYDYPRGKLVGGLGIPGSPDFLGGLCSNAAGDVFVTAEPGIYEYPHGRARPIAVLGDPEGTANGCSIDPTTGDLAAISGTGVAIYRPAVRDRWHIPELFNLNPDVSFGGYDGRGNLFVDGKRSGSQNFVIELAKGASKFRDVTLDESLTTPGNIEWDGGYLDIGDRSNLLIRRFAISGTRGTQIGSVALNGPAEIGQFWIEGRTFIGPSYSNGYYIGFWKYPRGGSATKSIDQDEAYGATVSSKPPRI